MAELILKIGSAGPDPFWQDGDVIEAFNNKRILCTHAQHICDHRKENFNRSGLRITNGLSQSFQEKIFEYKFERVSENEVKRTNLLTSEVDIIGLEPNDKGEYMDVKLYIARRKKNINHRIFGDNDAEIWYGGKTNFDKVNDIWDEIEVRTKKKRKDHKRLGAGKIGGRACLCLPVTDFDEERASFLVLHEESTDREAEVPEGEEPPEIMVRSRQHNINWRELGIGLKEGDVLDKTKGIFIPDELTIDEKEKVKRKKKMSKEKRKAIKDARREGRRAARKEAPNS